MPKIIEETDTDLKAIERSRQLGYKRGVAFLYQWEFALNPERQKPWLKCLLNKCKMPYK